ncbi:MAG: hypothetical protein HYW91_03310 [Candidatus Sungbacteria bacterium]|nr:hypothetical protein [Candidatus Sungbacteria bacterium]
MALAKKDLSQIRGVVHDEVEKAVETLATIINKSFNAVQKQIELLDKKIELIDGELQHITARLNTIEHDVADIRKHFVYRDEFEDAIARIALIEKKLGIRGGK